MNVRLTAVVRGRVQGVGFRYWTRRQAERLGLVGTATNRPDGAVEVVAEGPREAAERLLEVLGNDNTPGFVGGIDASWSEATDEFTAFRER
jgi:acylphosphatase